MPNTFFQKHLDLINDLYAKFPKGYRTIKKGYGRLIIPKYDAYRFCFYVTGHEFIIETEFKSLVHSEGFGIDYDNYIRPEETLCWTNNDWEQYKKKTTDILEALIKFGDLTQYCFESYCNWYYDYGKIVTDHIASLNEKWWTDSMQRHGVHGFYFVNALPTFIMPYKKNYDSHISFLEDFGDLVKTMSNRKDYDENKVCTPESEDKCLSPKLLKRFGKYNDHKTLKCYECHLHQDPLENHKVQCEPIQETEDNKEFIQEKECSKPIQERRYDYER